MFLARGSAHHRTSGLQMRILGIKVVTSMEGGGIPNRSCEVGWVAIVGEACSSVLLIVSDNPLEHAYGTLINFLLLEAFGVNWLLYFLSYFGISFPFKKKKKKIRHACFLNKFSRKL